MIHEIWNAYGLNTTYLENNDFTSKKDIVSSKEFELFFNVFGVQNHFKNVLIHKGRIEKIYDALLKKCLPPKLTKEAIMDHDNSVLINFEEIVGFTIQNVWKVSSNLFSRAAEQHFLTNPHHPEYFSMRTQERLNEDNGEEDVEDTEESEDEEERENLHENMNHVDLLESIVDKIALNWEHHFGNYDEPSPLMWNNLPEKYLKKYTQFDKRLVKDILKSCDS